jgi:hypothetical protein
MGWFGKSKRELPERAGVPADAALSAVDVPRVDFVIPGAMKCGTTALRRALMAHPGIHMPDGEQHFFGNHRRYLSVWKGGALDAQAFEEVYAAPFRSNQPLVGGKTPNYVISTLTLERLQRFHPDAKIIFMVRCPVARAQSHWNHVLRQRDKGKRPAFLVAGSFSEQIDRDEEELVRARDPAAEVRGTNILWRGMYATQLLHLRHFFPADRIFVGALEDLKSAPEPFLRDLCELLGIPFDPAMSAAAAAGEGRAPGHTETLTDADRTRLRDLYSEPVRSLEELLGREMPGWLAD